MSGEPMKRRDFLRFAGPTAAGFLLTRPYDAVGQMIGGSGPFNDYRALVCVFLFGGNDSFNMLVPRSAAEYGAYATSRAGLAVAQTDLLPIDALDPDGALYGVHPSMPHLQTLFAQESAAFVANVGPLIVPTSKAQYVAKSVPLPPQLFSHNDQQDQWHSLRGRELSDTGWAGRMADLIRLNVASQQLATNVSLAGNSLFQSGDDTVAYTMGATGPLAFQGFTGLGGEQRRAFERIINASYDSVYARGYAEVQRRAVEAADRVTAAIGQAQTLTTQFPTTPLGQQLQTVARLISVRDRLAMQRQVFFVSTGGFDSHDDQLVNQPTLLGNVSTCLKAFYDATVELGVAQSVTAFTQSDFGRTLTSNGDGTDHAWGGVQVVVGQCVRGRRVFGRYPSLALNGPEDVGGGRLIPGVSADQYAATLARWFGIAEADLAGVAPNIGNFAERDLGFLA
ncbi:MAG TPA: DUF1501 domain-containing protein [Gammaproteobacteria bacterium]|nr:DUF1501 domain-containing protein [Gammaproteobacteria bacterium]